jgi:hypothetical protein
LLDLIGHAAELSRYLPRRHQVQAEIDEGGEQRG